MKAIKTKYLAPTNTRGSRIKASDLDGNNITITYSSNLDIEDAHAEAARALIDKMGWGGRWIAGALDAGYVFVRDEPHVAHIYAE